jgi:hypothetical protein
MGSTVENQIWMKGKAGARRIELSTDEYRSSKGRSWVPKSCNVARPNDEGENLRNDSVGVESSIAETPEFGGKQHYAACMPLRLFSQSVSPPDQKILLLSTERTTSSSPHRLLSTSSKKMKKLATKAKENSGIVVSI